MRGKTLLIRLAALAVCIAVAAATPVASPYEKDLSGFGDADDFEFEEID